MKTSSIIGIIVLIALIVLAIVFLPKGQTDRNAPQGNGAEEVFCTMDAMLCPDGTYVGRIPPNCEFAACPDGSVPGTATSPETGTDNPVTNPEFFGEGK